MEKIVKIGEIEVAMKTSGAVPRIYRNTFNRDLFADMEKLSKEIKAHPDGSGYIEAKSVDIYESLAWVFAKHADPTVPDIEAWLEQFDPYAFYAVLPEVMEMWIGENVTTSTLKKSRGKSTGK